MRVILLWLMVGVFFVSTAVAELPKVSCVVTSGNEDVLQFDYSPVAVKDICDLNSMSQAELDKAVNAPEAYGQLGQLDLSRSFQFGDQTLPEGTYTWGVYAREGGQVALAVGDWRIPLTVEQHDMNFPALTMFVAYLEGSYDLVFLYGGKRAKVSVKPVEEEVVTEVVEETAAEVEEEKEEDAASGWDVIEEDAWESDISWDDLEASDSFSGR